MRFLDSPNCKPRVEPIRFVIVHGTWMADDNEAFQRLCDPVAEVSCHYFIQKDGTVVQLVKDNMVAWHAGVSQWGDVVGLNASSLGIEMSNTGCEPYTVAQYDALKALLSRLISEYNVPLKNVLAHSDIAPDRKDDPGAHFDWFVLYDAGVAMPLADESADVATLRSVGYCGDDVDILKAHRLRF